MTPRRSSDILADSPAWTRLRSGLPPEMEDPSIRRVLHDYAQVVTALVGELDSALDDIDKLHDRVDRRTEAHEVLQKDLFNPKDGHFVEMRNYIDERFGKLTAPMLVLIGSVVSGLILLAVTRMTEGGA